MGTRWLIMSRFWNIVSAKSCSFQPRTLMLAVLGGALFVLGELPFLEKFFQEPISTRSMVLI